MKPRKSKKNLVKNFFQIPRHTEIYISPDGRSISEIAEERRVEPIVRPIPCFAESSSVLCRRNSPLLSYRPEFSGNHIRYTIHESSVYRNPPLLVTKKNRKTKKHLRKSRRNKT